MGRALIGLVIIAVCAFVFIGPSKGQASVGTEAPGFALSTPRGQTVSLSQLRGQVVVLDFWASWCPPCRAAIPAMQRIHDTYKDRGVKVLGINLREQQDPVEFMRMMDANYTVLTHGEQVAAEYQVKGIPTLIVVNKTGEVVYRESGWSSDCEIKMTQAIEKALAQ